MCDKAIILSAVLLASGEMADIHEYQLVVDHQSSLGGEVQKLGISSRQYDTLRSLLGLWGICGQNDSCHIQLLQSKVTLFRTTPKSPYILVPSPTQV